MMPKEPSSKDSKASAHYRLGTQHKHCGRTEKWLYGSCRHFLPPSGCSHVAGVIDRTYLCDWWERQGKKKTD